MKINKEKSIFLSIKPKFVELILNQTKNHEFRTRIPNNEVEFLFVYTTNPVWKFQYIIKVDKQIQFPENIKLENNWIWNSEFNNWEKKAKFAYPILNLFELKKPLSLKELKEDFWFIVPQGFYYLDKCEKVFEYVERIWVRKIF